MEGSRTVEGRCNKSGILCIVPPSLEEQSPSFTADITSRSRTFNLSNCLSTQLFFSLLLTLTTLLPAISAQVAAGRPSSSASRLCLFHLPLSLPHLTCRRLKRTICAASGLWHCRPQRWNRHRTGELTELLACRRRFCAVTPSHDVVVHTLNP
jgi:hypothetical protein